VQSKHVFIANNATEYVPAFRRTFSKIIGAQYSGGN
jgi:hypothetical protein